MFHAGGAAAFRYGFVYRIARRRLAEQIAPGGAEPRHALLVQGQLANRPQRKTFEFFGAALAGGIEAANRLNRIAKKIQPHRVGGAARENIDNAAAHSVFTRLHHRIGAAIAVRFQKRNQIFRRHNPVHGNG